MAPSYHLQIITPQGIPYQGDVIHTLVPAENGFVGVLANHAPYVTSSAGGKLEVREKEGTEKKFRVGPGFFEVVKNQASFFTESFTS
ncbi:MAG: F0F1 ATP synthase subunit epsilon [Candidatus Omnitrophica bacterium]|nr:F0F1 ATP synthase subunit epsilon [Candidatus Omnitrophota bacterium]